MQIKLTVEYDGAAFHGWQLQPHGPTVQGVLEQALGTLCGEPVRVRGAGRTDAGVHALGQVATFRTAACPDLRALRTGLNALTPPEVAVTAVETVPDEFDARRVARSRTYEYRIWNAAVPSPFWRRYAWHRARPLDVAAMERCAASLEGEHDFSAFRAAGCEAATTVRRVLASRLRRAGALVTYRIEATAFLRHMVRNIVGTLVEVGEGERTAEDFAEVFAARDRTRAGITAPAHGLVLVGIRYEDGTAAEPRSGCGSRSLRAPEPGSSG